MTARARTVAAVIVLLAALAALGVCIAREDAVPSTAEELPSVLRIDRDGLRYTYHVPTGDEGLFDLAADPRMLTNLRPSRPADALRLREALQRELRAKLGVESLEELRRAQRDVVDRLRALGYF